MKHLKGNLLLFVTSLIWGTAFVAQSASMKHIGPFTFNFIRCSISILCITPVMLMSFKKYKLTNSNAAPSDHTGLYKRISDRCDNLYDKEKSIKFKHVIVGIICGTALFIAMSLQQKGMVYTSVTNAGFITAMYIVMVPILNIIFKRYPRPITVLCVIAAVFGLYLLTVPENGGFSAVNKGDVYMIISALGFSVQIIVVEHLAKKLDGVTISWVQFIMCALLALPSIFIFNENVNLDSILAAKVSILYAGALSGGLAYTLQIVGQKDTEPTIASLIMSLESVFAVIAGIIILHESPTTRTLLGCAIMFAAIVISQIPSKKKNDKLTV